ncbi:iron-containing alcohol dehydrogenase [Photobacterium sp. 1_MG-2023]|uniref:iron-containing alcohol dehydrogenase n=1 Tax=Photobacterium sp. 1_MG-2023 TaxID=3062646 RepID=UPI0026E3A6C3|nr:iron-containing alcohol dehydrogenase [Photobacterium sp. 1_MG-2023]MDO6709006.1 iron-containing alcohol dehydrogenase [Photobacterium sp. 1_MG-2023]
MTQRIVMPGLMEIGAGALDKVADMMGLLACSQPLIVTDQVMSDLGYVKRVQNSLAAQGMACGVFLDTEPEPTEASILPAVDQVVTGQYDCLIALGGGSAIDSAKAIGLLAQHGGKMQDYKVPHVVTEAILPVIAIPTTAGTGSEVTRVTIITDQETDEKMLCMGPGLIPRAAIIDYELTLSVPARIAADTGIDALTHAMEAYVSGKAGVFTDQQALAAMRLIAPNLRQAVNQPGNHAAKEKLMLGATMAGMAFSNASVALVHGMSRPIGAHFHVPHGMSNAMLLPVITEFSILASLERYADCARAMGLADDIISDQEAVERLMIELRQLNQDLKVPSLSAFGIDKAQYFSLLDTMAEQALASGSPNNNPRVPSKEQVIELYEKVWSEG